MRASVVYVLTIQRVKWRANVLKGMPNFQTFFLENAKENFYTLLLHKKFYIILDIIVVQLICICFIHKNCIILHFYNSCHIKEKFAGFFVFEKLCSLVKNENTERPGLYT